jgi:hypothetical protein
MSYLKPQKEFIERRELQYRFIARADPKHDVAVSVLDNARQSRYTILVTHHVLSEILDVLKNKLVTHQRVRIHPSTQTLEGLVKGKFKEFSVRLLGLTNVRIKNPHVSTHEVLRPSFSLLYKYFGMIKQDSECPICGSQYDFIKCDTVYEDDALHALLAWNLNCDLFITFDKDFLQLKNEGSLSPMTIQVL